MQRDCMYKHTLSCFFVQKALLPICTHFVSAILNASWSSFQCNAFSKWVKAARAEFHYVPRVGHMGGIIEVLHWSKHNQPFQIHHWARTSLSEGTYCLMEIKSRCWGQSTIRTEENSHESRTVPGDHVVIFNYWSFSSMCLRFQPQLYYTEQHLQGKISISTSMRQSLFFLLGHKKQRQFCNCCGWFKLYWNIKTEY